MYIWTKQYFFIHTCIFISWRSCWPTHHSTFSYRTTPRTHWRRSSVGMGSRNPALSPRWLDTGTGTAWRPLWSVRPVHSQVHQSSAWAMQNQLMYHLTSPTVSWRQNVTRSASQVNHSQRYLRTWTRFISRSRHKCLMFTPVCRVGINMLMLRSDTFYQASIYQQFEAVTHSLRFLYIPGISHLKLHITLVFSQNSKITRNKQWECFIKMYILG